MNNYQRLSLEDEIHNREVDEVHLTSEDIKKLYSFEYYPVMQYLDKVQERNFDFQYDKFIYDGFGRSERE